ncbi:hypothetical protein [Nonomuraea roseola]|uniref:Uncharacterized protein n=1 Tax=Nonomuraea roseola TaxID=46179 RepID=A0ABV5Q4H5_9ACTN
MDALSFTPWRVTAEHAPLGDIMRARKEVYRRSSLQRHRLNQQEHWEPRSAGMLAHLAPRVASSARWWEPPDRAWSSVALSHSGLRALGVPQSSLDSFPAEFRQGMRA